MSDSGGNSFADRYKKSSGPATEDRKSSGGFAEKYAKKDNMTATNIGVNASPENQAKRADASLLFLVKGIDDNRPAWYYVLIERLKLPMFKKALNDNIIHLEEYGKILYSAYGDHPPEEIKKKIRDEFGIPEE
jgi:hypothetical protein|tara:strand:+ start:9256 stop:9654 length:399 start_codon:yes stop_codon:yes gene_type:complete